MQLPPEISGVIGGLVESARAALGDALRSVVLYGSAAEGRLRATSDVNLLFILTRFDPSVNDFREPFRFAQAAVNVTAMFVVEDELPDAAEAFAQKFADIERRHVVLYGDDLVAKIDIPRRALVRRLQQMLLNLTLRLRASYVELSLREEQCALTVAEAAAPLRTAAASILELEGQGTLAPKEALLKVVGQIGRYDDIVAYLSEARQTRALPPGEAAAILWGTYELARALHDRSQRLEP